MLNVQLQVNKGNHLIKIMDVAGKTWSAFKYDLVAGNQVIKLNVSSIASGAYIIMVQHPDGKTDRVNFIKAN